MSLPIFQMLQKSLICTSYQTRPLVSIIKTHRYRSYNSMNIAQISKQRLSLLLESQKSQKMYLYVVINMSLYLHDQDAPYLLVIWTKIITQIRKHWLSQNHKYLKNHLFVLLQMSACIGKVKCTPITCKAQKYDREH
jgi:hypothetical protein